MSVNYFGILKGITAVKVKNHYVFAFKLFTEWSYWLPHEQSRWTWSRELLWWWWVQFLLCCLQLKNQMLRLTWTVMLQMIWMRVFHTICQGVYLTQHIGLVYSTNKARKKLWRQRKTQECGKRQLICTMLKVSELGDVPEEWKETIKTPTFNVMFSNDLIFHVTNQTNLYTIQHSKGNWNVQEEKMQTFIAVLLLSGYCKVLYQDLNWADVPDIHNEGIACAICRCSFQEIFSNLHLDGNSLITDGRYLFVQYLRK